MRTKQLKFILPAALLLLLLLVFLISASRTDPNAPRYVPAKTQPVGPFGAEVYDWNSPIPFRDGKVWIWTVLSRTNRHSYLYDIDNRQVLGELFNGGVVLANRDQTKFLCGGQTFPVTSFKEHFIAFLNKASFGKIRIPTNRIDGFWILDLKNNSARRAGQLSEVPGAGSTWRPSPDFRFGYDVPSNPAYEGKSFFLCDLDHESFTKINFAGKPQGWWNNQTILIKDLSGNMILFDVLTGKSSVLFSSETIKSRLLELKIPDEPADLTTKFHWNGDNYDVHVSAGKSGWASFTNSSFLLKIERDGPALKPLSLDFKFKWLGRFDVTGKEYVYPGESGVPGNGGNGGVYLRDVADNTEHTLVPPDNSGQYSIPRFYGDSVIYFNNHILWRVDLNGGKPTRLFAPAVTN